MTVPVKLASPVSPVVRTLRNLLLLPLGIALANLLPARARGEEQAAASVSAIRNDDEESLFEPVAEEQQLQVRKELESIWKAEQSGVATAEVDYLSLIFTLKQRKLTCEEFCQELGSVSLIADETLTRRLVERFCPEKLTGDEATDRATLQAVGDWRTYRHQGRERRCLSPRFEHVMLDDVHLLVDHPNRGVRAYRRGECQYWFETLDWFRVVPNASMLNDARLLTGADGMCRLEYYGPGADDLAQRHASWMVVNREDGLPREWRLYDPRTGALLRFELFQQFTLYPGNVQCPAVRMKVNVKEGYVTNVRMSVIREARFNDSLPEDAFTLSVPAQWAWFDWQEKDHTGGRWTKPVDNVAEFFRGRTWDESQPIVNGKTAQGTSWRSLLLMINGTLLVVVGVLLWRRSA